jgi:hypothetical protein
MRGAIPPLLQYVFMAWCLIKHRDIFTFILPYTGVYKFLLFLLLLLASASFFLFFLQLRN